MRHTISGLHIWQTYAFDLRFLKHRIYVICWTQVSVGTTPGPHKQDITHLIKDYHRSITLTWHQTYNRVAAHLFRSIPELFRATPNWQEIDINVICDCSHLKPNYAQVAITQQRIAINMCWCICGRPVRDLFEGYPKSRKHCGPNNCTNRLIAYELTYYLLLVTLGVFVWFVQFCGVVVYSLNEGIIVSWWFIKDSFRDVLWFALRR